MKIRNFIIFHWKPIVLLLQLGLFAMTAILINPLGDIVDSPVGP